RPQAPRAFGEPPRRERDHDLSFEVLLLPAWLRLVWMDEPLGPSRQGGSDSVSAKGRRRRPANRTSLSLQPASRTTEDEKRERREEAHRYRETIRRKAARRRYYRNAAYTLILVAAIGAIVFGATRP